MRLVYCKNCHDIFRVQSWERQCACGAVKAMYMDGQVAMTGALTTINTPHGNLTKGSGILMGMGDDRMQYATSIHSKLARLEKDRGPTVIAWMFMPNYTEIRRLDVKPEQSQSYWKPYPSNNLVNDSHVKRPDNRVVELCAECGKSLSFHIKEEHAFVPTKVRLESPDLNTGEDDCYDIDDDNVDSED